MILPFGLPLFLSFAFPGLFGSEELPLVPPPDECVFHPQEPACAWDKGLTFLTSDDFEDLEPHLRAVAGLLNEGGVCRVDVSDKPLANTIPLRVRKNQRLGQEEYTLKIRESQLDIQAATFDGVCHATATLLQLATHQMAAYDKGEPLVALDIRDQPKCSYRSVMVDLGRNPHSLGCLMETVDLAWFYKLDSVHLHLTDDQRFTFPSKAFPKLVTESQPISWKDFEWLESQARIRGVTLIPELEVPGHSTLLRRHYPEVFGENPTETAERPSSRKAMKVLLDEMIELFPSSPDIHIGGDEAYGVPVDIQRDLINELHAHLANQGRRTLVWEGPSLGRSDNKVHQDVVHIAWRTVDFPPDKMLEAGYSIVNAAWDPLYLVDHYPRNNFTMASQQTIYETLELFRFRHFNPGMPTFANPIVVEPTDKVLGFCMPWWEGREENYFPMIVPRLVAMAEVAWDPQRQRSYQGFAERYLASEESRRHLFHPVRIETSALVIPQDGVFYDSLRVELTNSEGDIHYTLDGSVPTVQSARYREPLAITESVVLRAKAFEDGVPRGHETRRTYKKVEPIANLALGKPVVSTQPSSPPFSLERLTDGGTGNLDYYLGYPAEPKPIAITIDLEELMSIDRVIVHQYLYNNGFESYVVQVGSESGEFRNVADRRARPETPSSSMIHDFPETKARFVRILTHGFKGQVFDSFSRLTEVQVFSTSKSPQ